ncbi:MAG TPA: molybdenum cofactor biosynthesis protein MoaE [Bacteroidota bacterium]|nr:molybdenum cofactor biosynthesis protein MoaE [Bacteroidota bacterium]
MIEIIKTPIDIPPVLESVRDTSAGAIDIFIGTTRDHAERKKVLTLEYEAYEPMAIRLMENIAREAQSRWHVKKISIVHRVGTVDVGEASIVIAVSAEHRSESFDACRFIIDTVKKTVPIWKKEYFVGGESWVGAGTKNIP